MINDDQPVSYVTVEPKFPKGYKYFKDWETVINGGPNMPVCYAISFPIDAFILDATAFCMFKKDSEIARHFDGLLDVFLYICSKVKGEFSSNDDNPNIVVILEILRHKDKTIKKPVGYRLWAFVNQRTWEPGTLIEGMIKKNKDDFEGEKDGTGNNKFKKRKDKKYIYESIRTIEDLMKMAQTLTKRPYTNTIPRIKSNNLAGPNNPMRPERVFDIEYAMQGIPNIDPIQSTVSNYREGTEQGGDLEFKFPANKCLYRLTQPLFDIDDFRLMTIPVAFEDDKREIGEFSFLKSLCDATDLSQVKIDAAEEEVGFDETIPLESLYDSGIAKKTTSGNAPITAQTLFEENNQARLEINTKINKLKKDGKKSPQQIQEIHEKLMSEFYNRALSKWPHVWSPMGNNSSTVKMAATWISDNTDQGKKSLFSPNRKSTSNLSYFSDFRISFRNYLEAVYKSSTAHEQTELAWYSMFNAYDPDMKNKLHLLQTGKGKEPMVPCTLLYL